MANLSKLVSYGSLVASGFLGLNGCSTGHVKYELPQEAPLPIPSLKPNKFAGQPMGDYGESLPESNNRNYSPPTDSGLIDMINYVHNDLIKEIGAVLPNGDLASDGKKFTIGDKRYVINAYSNVGERALSVFDTDKYEISGITMYDGADGQFDGIVDKVIASTSFLGLPLVKSLDISEEHTLQYRRVIQKVAKDLKWEPSTPNKKEKRIPIMRSVPSIIASAD